MNKKITIFFIIIGILFLLTIGYLFIGKSSKDIPNNSASTPISNSFPKDTDRITLNSPEGDIVIKNIYKDPIRNVSKGGVSFIENNYFHMSFYPDDQGFIIVILSPNVNKARIQAESAFLEKLGIDKIEACNLKVSLSVPLKIKADLAGKNYGLSFCPNGKPFL